MTRTGSRNDAASLIALQKTRRGQHGDTDIMHRANINQSVKIRELRSRVGKDDVERHLGDARRRLRPSIRIAQQLFDLDPLQASERLAQPSAEFVATPGQRNERPIALFFRQGRRQELERSIGFLQHAEVFRRVGYQRLTQAPPPP